MGVGRAPPGRRELRRTTSRETERTRRANGCRRGWIGIKCACHRATESQRHRVGAGALAHRGSSLRAVTST